MTTTTYRTDPAMQAALDSLSDPVVDVRAGRAALARGTGLVERTCVGLDQPLTEGLTALAGAARELDPQEASRSLDAGDTAERDAGEAAERGVSQLVQ